MSDLVQEVGLRPQPAGPERIGVVERNTTETKISLRLNIDGQRCLHHFDRHPLSSTTCWSCLRVTAALTFNSSASVISTSTNITLLRTLGIALGDAVSVALGDKKGILRAGYFVMAMDETLAVAAVDLSGRVAYMVDDLVNVPVVGDFQTELVTDFFDGFARGAKANVHVKTMYGRSNHHKIEAIFKAFARALRGACSRDARMKELLPSTKGLL